jgi:hypothetical protein
MANVTMDVVIGQLIAVLEEGVEGGSKGWTYFADSGAENALIGTLAKLTAAEASWPVGGSSIAAQVEHVTFALKAAADWIRGDRTAHNWEESWRVRTPDDATWPAMLEKLRGAYAELRKAIESHAASSVEAIGGAIGAVAHVAYHLGAIRQKVAYLRKG